MAYEFLLFSGIALLASILKGITGTGTTTVIVSLSALILPAKQTIVLASFLNVFSGLAMLRVGREHLPALFWIPIAIAMFIGAILGALGLSVIPASIFSILLAVAFLLVGLWFLFKSHTPAEPPESRLERARPCDLGVGLFAGCCGGLIGINAPPLVGYFGSYLPKSHLRRLLVLIFIPAAIAQTGTFLATGLLRHDTLIRGLFMLPAMVVGIYIGNRIHVTVSERVFRGILGVLLIGVSLKLLF